MFAPTLEGVVAVQEYLQTHKKIKLLDFRQNIYGNTAPNAPLPPITSSSGEIAKLEVLLRRAVKKPETFNGALKDVMLVGANGERLVFMDIEHLDPASKQRAIHNGKSVEMIGCGNRLEELVKSRWTGLALLYLAKYGKWPSLPIHLWLLCRGEKAV